MSEFQKARDYAYRLLHYRLRSRSEIEQRLYKKGYRQDSVGKLISQLISQGLIDDEKFARAWVNDRINARPVSRRFLQYQLQKKGVREGIIADTLKALAGSYDEYRAACELAKKRLRHCGELDKLKKKRRIAGYLKRRGFSFDIILRILNELIGE